MLHKFSNASAFIKGNSGILLPFKHRLLLRPQMISNNTWFSLQTAFHFPLYSIQHHPLSQAYHFCVHSAKHHDQRYIIPAEKACNLPLEQVQPYFVQRQPFPWSWACLLSLVRAETSKVLNAVINIHPHLHCSNNNRERPPTRSPVNRHGVF